MVAAAGSGMLAQAPSSSRRVNELQEGERFVPWTHRGMGHGAASSRLGGPSGREDSPGHACSIHVEGSVLCGQGFTTARGETGNSLSLWGAQPLLSV